MPSWKAAAQQALEAMTSFESGTNGLYQGEFAEEIAALKAALATCKEDLPVEPVAWMDIARDGTRLSVRMWSDGNFEEVPLYTVPPKRKPLTEAQVYAAIQGIDSLKAVEVACAIEKAHGIGGDGSGVA